ncbi:MAG: putative geopeptide radical SAM maturase [Desulfobacterales bacterium]|nr:putative geopeptide radical SAM maturase [Desulfobacterales bacterium]
MQLSHYIKIYPYEEKEGYLLLFSTKKVSKILIKEDTYQSIIKGSLSSSDETALSKLGMIVHDTGAEKQTMLNYLDNFNPKNPRLQLTVITNLDCNFACIYCYEGDMKGKHFMSDRNAEHLLDFIKDKFTPDKKFLNIDFHGGEPLLSAGMVKSVARAAKSFAESKGAVFTCNMITNGSLLKRQTAEELAQLGLKAVQITLDGPPEIHNKNRPFKSGQGSFDTIINNIKETWDIVKIGIGGNFEKHNYEKFTLLLDYLENTGLTPDKINTVRFGTVLKSQKGDTVKRLYNGGCMSFNEPWISEAIAMLREEILKRGYNTLKIKPGSCVINYTDSYVVNFDGVIYKCPVFIGKKDFAIGDVQTGVKDYTSIYKLNNWKNKDCAECVYLPLCYGGCRYSTLVRDGNIDGLECRKDFFDTSLEKMIKQDIRYQQRVK